MSQPTPKSIQLGDAEDEANETNALLTALLLLCFQTVLGAFMCSSPI